MPPTMYRCGILVVTLLSVALGEDAQPSTGSSSKSQAVLPTWNTELPLKMSDFCFFGKFPSASCRFKCGQISKDAYCDEEKKMCLCSGPEEEDEDSGEVFNPPQQAVIPGQQNAALPTPDSNPESHFTIPMHPVTSTEEPGQDQNGENKHHMVFYIFDLNKIFGKKKPSEDVNVTAEVGTQTDATDSPPEGVAAAGWTFQHLLALLIIVLLAILIFLEVYAFFKKRNTTNHVENIFKTMPIPDKS